MGVGILAAAIDQEKDIAKRAKDIRAGEKALDAELFIKLWPLLCEPIPEGFIQSVPKVTGKPYESTGIKSVQVQIDRMNNVLTPLWWGYKAAYEQDGRIAHVTVSVFIQQSFNPLTRSATGGVDRASTLGNLYKGSFTNAAKLAIARLGPGHEVYIGATDFDPDTDRQAAKAQAGNRTGDDRLMPKAKRESMMQAIRDAGKDPALVLASVGCASAEEATVGHAKLIEAKLR